MCTDHKKIILCKGLSVKGDIQETYVKTLESGGYTCTCLPTLRFEYINLVELKSCLSQPQMYLGLILTSCQAVEAVNLAVTNDEDLLEPWQELPTYCVGPTTEAHAKNYLKLGHCLGSQCGNSKELAEKICLNSQGESKSFLYPCSEIAKDTLEKILISREIGIKKLISYKTLPSKTLETDLLKLGDLQSNIYIFFSPSTVQYVTPLLQKHSIRLDTVKAVAIGPVTGEAVAQAGLAICAIAKKPNPNALLDAINDAVPLSEC